MIVKKAITVGTITLFIFYITFWQIIDDDYVYQYFAPTTTNVLLLFSLSIITIFTSSAIGRIFAFTWFCWPIFGTFFSLGHFYQHKLTSSIYMQEPNNVFMLNAIALLIPFILLERIWIKKSGHDVNHLISDWSGYLAAILIFFPIPYAISLIASGSTIFSGNNITDDIYTIDRGPLYLLRAILPISCTILCLYFYKARKAVRWPLVIYICFILGASVIDGKRDIFLVSSIAIITTVLVQSPKRSSAFVVGGGISLLVAYGAVSQIRAGEDKVGFDGLLGIATIAGIEYRDFAYSINYWSRDDIASYGYDWVESTIASVANRQILAVFGVNKDEWVQKDSARTWKKAFQVDDGIRIGLPGELHYAFGQWSLFVSAVIGIAIAFLLRNIVRTRSATNFTFLTVSWSFVSFLPFSQTTAVSGAFPTLFYIYLVAYFLRLKPRKDQMTSSNLITHNGLPLTLPR